MIMTTNFFQAHKIADRILRELWKKKGITKTDEKYAAVHLCLGRTVYLKDLSVSEKERLIDHLESLPDLEVKG
jgi:hypothetical protein